MIATAATSATSATMRASGAVPRKFLLLPSRRPQRVPAGKLAETCDALHIGRPRAARRAPLSTPSTSSVLSRAVWPRTTVTREGAMPALLATRRHSAALAFPSTGGAVTRMRTAPSRSPTTSSRRARGWSRTRSSVMLLEVAPLQDHPARASARPPPLHDGLAAAHLARLIEKVLETGAEHRPARRTALQASDRVHEHPNLCAPSCGLQRWRSSGRQKLPLLAKRGPVRNAPCARMSRRFRRCASRSASSTLSLPCEAVAQTTRVGETSNAIPSCPGVAGRPLSRTRGRKPRSSWSRLWSKRRLPVAATLTRGRQSALARRRVGEINNDVAPRPLCATASCESASRGTLPSLVDQPVKRETGRADVRPVPWVRPRSPDQLWHRFPQRGSRSGVRPTPLDRTRLGARPASPSQGLGAVPGVGLEPTELSRAALLRARTLPVCLPGRAHQS